MVRASDFGPRGPWFDAKLICVFFPHMHNVGFLMTRLIYRKSGTRLDPIVPRFAS